jgi:hypothetical protein
LEKRIKNGGEQRNSKKRYCLKRGKLLSNIPFQFHWESNRKKIYDALKPSGNLRGELRRQIPENPPPFVGF